MGEPRNSRSRRRGRPGWFSAAIAGGAACLLLSCGESARRPNILLITMDTTRADHLAPYGYRDSRTPFIGELAENGVLFERAFTPVPITLPSHSTMMTGQYPATHGVRDNGIFALRDEATTLAEVLGEAGYRTAAFVGSFVLDSRFGLSQGFDVYDDVVATDLDRSPTHFQERPAEEVTDAALHWLRTGPEPFFLWVHYFDPHADYAPPSPYRETYRQNPYDGEISYVDSQIGRLLFELTGQEQLDRTLIALVGDHGEGLWEHREASHSIFVYDSTMRVPFVLAFPTALPSGLRVERPVRTLDLMPTVLGLLGIDSPPGVEGEDLRAVIRSAGIAEASDDSASTALPAVTPPEGEWSIFLEQYATEYRFGWSPLRGIRTERFKYIEAPHPELYDLVSDPYEYFNVVSEQADIARALRERLETGAPRENPEAQRLPLDRETEERLRSLGYAWGPEAEGGDTVGGDPKSMLESLYLLFEARALAQQGALVEATKIYERILALDPTNFTVLLDFSFLGAQAEEWEGIAQQLVQILERSESAPIRFMVSVNLGNIHLTRADPGAAERYYREAEAIDPESPIPPTNLALLLLQQGRLDESRRLCEKALAVEPDFAEARHYLGALAEAEGNRKEAERIYREILETHPHFLPGMNSLAWLWARDGTNLEEAEGLANKAVSEDPRNADYIDTLGWIHYRRNDFARAAPLLERAVALDADNAEFGYHLGAVYARLGREAEARDLLQAALHRPGAGDEPWRESARRELQGLENHRAN